MRGKQQGSCTKEMAAVITAPQPMRLMTLSVIQGQESNDKTLKWLDDENEDDARDNKAPAPRKWLQ